MCGTIFKHFYTKPNARKVFKNSECVLRNVCVTTAIWLVSVLFVELHCDTAKTT